MIEELNCTQCQNPWQREKAKGRKPVICPECALQEPSPEPAPQHHWQCKCGYTYTTRFTLSTTPTHKCKPRGKHWPMTKME